jgi:hypothetical protein
VIEEKNEILELFPQNELDKEIGMRHLLLVFALLLAGLSLFVPKVFLSSSIYYKSLDLSVLRDTRQGLEEENVYLKQEIELLRYQSEILNDANNSVEEL